MNLSSREYNGILRAIQGLNASLESRSIRARFGKSLLDLLGADYFASYVWDEQTDTFTNRVFINMSDDNLQAYESYFQFHDPITRRLQVKRTATCVSEVMAQRDLVRTEFFNDFLLKDGLYYGINLYVYDGNRNIGDIRIWRNRKRNNFDRREVEILETLKPHFRNAMRNVLSMGHRPGGSNMDPREVGQRLGLTLREAQIAVQIATGKTDQQIAHHLDIAHSTLRTHLKHIYAKLNIHNRASLIRLLATA